MTWSSACPGGDLRAERVGPPDATLLGGMTESSAEVPDWDGDMECVRSRGAGPAQMLEEKRDRFQPGRQLKAKNASGVASLPHA